MPVSNDALSKKIDSLDKKFDGFFEQYVHDMHGDTKLKNGERGVIGEIRELKEYRTKYPSLLWLFAHKPVQTVGAVIAIYAALLALSTLGLLKLAGELLGVPLP